MFRVRTGVAARGGAMGESVAKKCSQREGNHGSKNHARGILNGGGFFVYTRPSSLPLLREEQHHAPR